MLEPMSRNAPNAASPSLPGASELSGPDKGIRAIALWEGAKGILGFALALAIWFFLDRGLMGFVQQCLSLVHLDPAWVTGHGIRLAGVIALLYACLRFIAAFGLWREYAWAKWYSILGAVLYFPFLLRECLHGPTLAKAGMLAFNVGMISYLTWSVLRQLAPSQLPTPEED